MNPQRYKKMLSALNKLAKANKNKIYPGVHEYPRRFDILDKQGNTIAVFKFANLTEGYRYVNDKGGVSKEYVPFSVVRDIFKYFNVKKYEY